MSNPSNIYVDGRENDMECVSRNQNKIEVAHDKCGVVNEKTVCLVIKQAFSTGI